MQNKYSKKFDYACYYVMQNEGGFNCDPNDSGGATNFGISLRFCIQNCIDNFKNYDDIENMTESQAKNIYYHYIYAPNRYEEIKNDSLSLKVFDMAFPLGSPRANSFLQKSLISYYVKNEKDIEDDLEIDSIIGKETLKYINAAKHQQCILLEFIDLCVFHFKYLTRMNPQLKKFLKGWLNRVNKIPFNGE